MTVRTSPEPDTAAPTLAVESLRRRFGVVPALDDVSLQVQPGEVVGVVGPNGAGKSTLMNTIAGSEGLDEGEIRFRGRRIDALPPHRRSRLGIGRTFQLPADFGRLTVLENLLMGVRSGPGESFLRVVLGRDRWWTDAQARQVARARVLLDEVDLRRLEDAYTSELSGGQRRIVELLRALMGSPKLLLLDEPFAGLHEDIVWQVGRHLQRLGEGGGAVLLIAHEFDAVEEICDRVVVMARGRRIFDGTMDEARNEPGVIDAYVAG